MNQDNNKENKKDNNKDNDEIVSKEEGEILSVKTKEGIEIFAKKIDKIYRFGGLVFYNEKDYLDYMSKLKYLN